MFDGGEEQGQVLVEGMVRCYEGVVARSSNSNLGFSCEDVWRCYLGFGLLGMRMDNTHTHIPVRRSGG